MIYFMGVFIIIFLLCIFAQKIVHGLISSSAYENLESLLHYKEDFYCNFLRVINCKAMCCTSANSSKTTCR